MIARRRQRQEITGAELVSKHFRPVWGLLNRRGSGYSITYAPGLAGLRNEILVFETPYMCVDLQAHQCGKDRHRVQIRTSDIGWRRGELEGRDITHICLSQSMYCQYRSAKRRRSHTWRTKSTPRMQIVYRTTSDGLLLPSHRSIILYPGLARQDLLLALAIRVKIALHALEPPVLQIPLLLRVIVVGVAIAQLVVLEVVIRPS